MLGLGWLTKRQARWRSERDAAAVRSVIGDRRAGHLIAEGWEIDRVETATLRGTSTGTTVYHMRRPTR